jgi:hypothetical protein
MIIFRAKVRRKSKREAKKKRKKLKTAQNRHILG